MSPEQVTDRRMTAPALAYRATCENGHPDATWTAHRAAVAVYPSTTPTREESTVTVTCDACGDGL